MADDDDKLGLNNVFPIARRISAEAAMTQEQHDYFDDWDFDED